jgi:hypothetical protein
MKQRLIAFAAALVLGLPVGALFAILLTPVLWKLEPVLHMELAGHSGPADWVYGLTWGLATPVIYSLIRFFLRRNSRSSG